MLQQSYIASQSLSLVPTGSIERSAAESRALALLQLVLIHGANEQYVTHPEFVQGFRGGYRYEDFLKEFGDDEIVLDDVLGFIEDHFSLSFLQQQNQQLARLHMSPMAYEYCIGFALGFLRWLFDAERAPWMPLFLLQKWYAIEYLTRSVAARCGGQERHHSGVQTVALGTYWE